MTELVGGGTAPPGSRDMVAQGALLTPCSLLSSTTNPPLRCAFTCTATVIQHTTSRRAEVQWKRKLLSFFQRSLKQQVRHLAAGTCQRIDTSLPSPWRRAFSTTTGRYLAPTACRSSLLIAGTCNAATRTGIRFQAVRLVNTQRQPRGR